MTIVPEQAISRLQELMEKHERLVWYARSRPSGHPSWDSVPADIKRGALNCQARVEEQWPDEVDRLKDPDLGDWEHGFNSGVLAAARLMAAYLVDPGEPLPDAEPEEAFTWDEQIDSAEAEFPELYT